MRIRFLGCILSDRGNHVRQDIRLGLVARIMGDGSSKYCPVRACRGDDCLLDRHASKDSAHHAGGRTFKSRSHPVGAVAYLYRAYRISSDVRNLAFI